MKTYIFLLYLYSNRKLRPAYSYFRLIGFYVVFVSLLLLSNILVMLMLYLIEIF